MLSLNRVGRRTRTRMMYHLLVSSRDDVIVLLETKGRVP